MIAYKIDKENSITINVAEKVSNSEMSGLSFSVEALVEGNPNTSIHFRLQKGLQMCRIKQIERLCEDIPNAYSIERVTLARSC